VPIDDDTYPGPREIYENYVSLIAFFGPQPHDFELEREDEMVEQTNRKPGISAGGPSERIDW
jgi:hypothetical protein